ncbi:extracellular solute-binding protein [Patescibacteria group bacterium]
MATPDTPQPESANIPDQSSGQHQETPTDQKIEDQDNKGPIRETIVVPSNIPPSPQPEKPDNLVEKKTDENTPDQEKKQDQSQVPDKIDQQPTQEQTNEGSSSQDTYTVNDAPTDAATDTSSEASQPTKKKGANKILIVLLILLFLGAIGYGLFYFWGKFSGGGQVTLTYWGLWENDAIIRPVIDEFEASNKGITIDYIKQSHKQYRERVQAAVSRGEGPDVFRFHNTWVGMLRNELDIAPSEAFTSSEFANTFYNVAKNDLVAGQSIYGIPLEFDGLGLYINEDIFSAAGASAPLTWEDVLSLVPTLTVKNDDNITTSAIALGTTNNVEHFSDIVATMILQNGGNLVQPTGKEAEEALIFYRKFSDEDDPVYTWNDTLDNSIYAFATGKVAMILAPSWRAFDIKQITPTANFRIVPVPQLAGNTVNWASYWVEGVSAKSKNKKAAWEFVKFLSSKEAVTKIYTQASKVRLFGEPYARRDLASTLAGDRYTEAYVKQAETARSFPLASKTYDNGLNDKMIKYLEDAINSVVDGNSPTQALSTAAEGFRQVLGQYGLTSSAPTN